MTGEEVLIIQRGPEFTRVQQQNDGMLVGWLSNANLPPHTGADALRDWKFEHTLYLVSQIQHHFKGITCTCKTMAGSGLEYDYRIEGGKLRSKSPSSLHVCVTPGPSSRLQVMALLS